MEGIIILHFADKKTDQSDLSLVTGDPESYQGKVQQEGLTSLKTIINSPHHPPRATFPLNYYTLTSSAVKQTPYATDHRKSL